MKFSNIFSVCVVLASTLTAVTALPIANGLVARDPYRSRSGRLPPGFARSSDELDARDPLFGIKLPKLPFKLPFPFKFPFRRDLEDDFVASLFNRSPDEIDDLVSLLSKRDGMDLEARGFFDFVKKWVPRIVQAAPKIISGVKSLWGRDMSEDFMDALLQSRSPDDYDDLASLLGDLNKRDVELVARSFWGKLISWAPKIIKAAPDIIKGVKSLWGRDLTDEHIARFIDDFVGQLSRRDDEGAEVLAEILGAVRRELVL